MRNKITYEDFSREELIDLITVKNKQIDSQRAMLNQSRVRRDKLQAKVTEGRKIIKENTSLMGQVEKLNQRLGRLIDSGRGKVWSMKEHAPVIMNAIMAYHKLKKEEYVTNNEMAFLILAYQKEFFFLSDVEKFNKKCGRNPDWNWRNDLYGCCEAGFICSDKMNGKRYYFLSYYGRERLERLLKVMFERGYALTKD